MNLPEGWRLVGFGGQHRGKKMLDGVQIRSSYLVGSIRGIGVCIVKVEAGWLLGEYYDDDKKFKDLGPFATIEEAIVLFQLLKD